MHRALRGWLCVTAWLAVLASTAPGQDAYPGTEIPGTRTPIALGDPVRSSPQRGYVVFAPRKPDGPTPWNCLAHAEGHADVWIQPGDGARGKPGGEVVQVATMSEILADDSCTVVGCTDPPDATACAEPSQLVWLLYGLPKGAAPPPPDTLPADDYWLHAMRRTPTGWTSKDGTRERRDDIADPYEVLDFYALGQTRERTVIRCACCPLAGAVTSTTAGAVPTTSQPRPPASSSSSSTTTVTSTSTTSSSTTTTAPQRQAVRLSRTLSPRLPAGNDICLDRLAGGYVVAAHGASCPSPHLHSVPGVGMVVRLGGTQEGPFEDPDPSGCGYGPIVLIACPAE